MTAKFVSSLFDEFAKLQKAIISFVMSVCQSASNNLDSADRFLMKFDT